MINAKKKSLFLILFLVVFSFSTLIFVYSFKESNVSYALDSILPSEYQQVEYIETDGNQKIDTGINTVSSLNCECEFEVLSDLTTRVFGAVDFYFYSLNVIRNGNTQFRWYRSGIGPFANIGSGKHKIKVYQNESNKLVDLDDYPTASISFSSFDVGVNLTLFSVGGSGMGPNRIYYFKLSQGDALLRDFVPCYRKADNVVGMYDLVNGVFYTNAGTGVFLKGEDVLNNEVNNTDCSTSFFNAIVSGVDGGVNIIADSLNTMCSNLFFVNNSLSLFAIITICVLTLIITILLFRFVYGFFIKRSKK